MLYICIGYMKLFCERNRVNLFRFDSIYRVRAGFSRKVEASVCLGIISSLWLQTSLEVN